MTDVPMYDMPLTGKLCSEISKISCVYKLVVFLDKEYSYVGQTVNLRKRIKEHRYCIKRGRHVINMLPQYDYQNTSIKIIIIETPEYEMLTIREQHHIDALDRNLLINSCTKASAPKTNLAKGISIDVAKKRGSLKVPVVGISLLDKTILKLESIRDSSEHGFNSSLVQRCVAGFIKQHSGYVWVKAEEFNKSMVKKIRKDIILNRFFEGINKKELVAVSENEVKFFSSTSSLKDQGFDRRAVHRVLNSNKYKHKGFLFFDKETYERMKCSN